MHCNIQKKLISEITELWSVLIDFTSKKILQFYVLADSLSNFESYYSLLSDLLGLIKSGEFKLQLQSTSLKTEIVKILPLTAQNHSFTVKNFGTAWKAKPEEWYSRNRFGHDYDQELAESRSLIEALKDFEGKIVIFTWIDSSNPGLIRTAAASQFKDGIIEPTK